MRKTTRKGREPKRTVKLPTIKWKWNNKKGEKFFEKPTVDSTEVLISGKIVTLLILSFVSGIIDLVFFSGLSKSVFKIATVSVAAGIVYTLMSIGFTSAKFWCATQLSVIKELQARLKENGLPFKALNKPKLRWNVIHKFLIGVSLITAISLSVVSIGDAVRKNQNVIKRTNTDIEKITKLANTTDKSDEVQFSALIKSSTASETAVGRAQADAAKIWPIIEDYRSERAEFEAEFGNNFSSKEEVVFKGQTIVPDTYWDKQNSLVQTKVKAAGRNLSITQIRNITSEAVLANQIKREIETSTSNSASNKLEELSAQTKDKAIQEIENLQGRYFMPGSEEAVVFDPNNISGAIATLGDIKAAYENDTGDVGESSKVFMLIGPVIDKKKQVTASDVESAYLQEVDTSSFGTTEVMMMILIMIFGIVQEFIIALYTPKSTIDRKTLSQFSEYLDLKEMENNGLDINHFLIKIYNNYLDDGSYSQAKYEFKMDKVIEVIAKRNSNWIEHEIEAKTKYYASLYEEAEKDTSKKENDQQVVIEDLSKQLADLRAKLNTEPVKAVDISKVPLSTAFQDQLKQLAVEAPMDKPNWERELTTLTQKPALSSENSSILNEEQKGYSNKVDDAINEIDELLKED